MESSSTPHRTCHCTPRAAQPARPHSPLGDRGARTVPRLAILPARRMAQLAVLASLATCLHYVEGFFPPMPVPGARLGLANLVATVALYTLGPADAVAVAALRSLLGSLLAGKFLGLGFAMSLAGATSSALVMGLVRALLRTSPVTTSTVGGLVHNLTQVLVACLVIGVGILPYVPSLVVLGLLAGWITGNLARPAITALTRSTAVAPTCPRRATGAPARGSTGVPPGRTVRPHPAWKWVTACAVLLALGLAWGAQYVAAGDQRDLVVELYNQEVARIPLIRDAPPRYLQVELPGAGGYHATIEVRGGRARILPIPEEFCPRGICSHTGWIERPGQAAICLPNRLVIRVVERPR